MSDQEPRDITWLNSKWWYRLLKLFTIIFFLVSTLAMAISSYEERPRDYGVPEQDKSTILCDSGKSFYYKDIPSLVGLISGGRDINLVNYVCETGSLPSFDVGDDFALKKFTTNDIYPRTGSWSLAMGVFTGSVSVLLLAIWVVRGCFLYVVTGKWSPKKL